MTAITLKCFDIITSFSCHIEWIKIGKDYRKRKDYKFINKSVFVSMIVVGTFVVSYTTDIGIPTITSRSDSSCHILNKHYRKPRRRDTGCIEHRMCMTNKNKYTCKLERWAIRTPLKKPAMNTGAREGQTVPAY